MAREKNTTDEEEKLLKSIYQKLEEDLANNDTPISTEQIESFAHLIRAIKAPRTSFSK